MIILAAFAALIMGRHPGLPQAIPGSPEARCEAKGFRPCRGIPARAPLGRDDALSVRFCQSFVGGLQ